MKQIQAYFDGAVFRPLETFDARPNQRAVITLTEEFVDLTDVKKRSARGLLSTFAAEKKEKKENTAD